MSKILSQAPPALRRIDPGARGQLDKRPETTTRPESSTADPLDGLCWDLLGLADAYMPTCSFARRRGGKPCRCPSCPACVWSWGKLKAQEVLAGLECADEAGRIAASITLTAPAGEKLNRDPFQSRFEVMSRRLQRHGLRWPRYASTWGANPTTARLHRHLLVIEKRAGIDKSTYASYAEKAGLGSYM